MLRGIICAMPLTRRHGLRRGLLAKYSPDQERDELGRFADEGGGGSGSESGAGTSPQTLPVKVTSIDQAIQLLGDGHGVMFERPEQAVSLVHRIAGIVREAKASGTEAKTYDLCKVSVANTNLFCAQSMNIPRSGMPQLSGIPTPGSAADSLPKNAKGEVDIGPAWRDSLTARGIDVTDASVSASFLRATQNQLNGNKVAGITAALEAGTLPSARLFTSQEDYIVDGHHRWAADVAYSIERGEPVLTDIARVDMPILKLLADANGFAASMGLRSQGIKRARNSGLSRKALFDFTSACCVEPKYSPDQPRDDHGRFGESETTTADPARLDHYHGTNVAFDTGGIVRAASVIGAQGRDARHYSPDFVYTTTSQHGAEMYAMGAAARNGGEPHVFRVKPIGAVVPDPEQVASGYHEITSYATSMARVVEELPLSGRLKVQDGEVMRTSPAERAITSVKEGATRTSLYRTVPEAEYRALDDGSALPAGAHNEERLGSGASFAQAPKATLHYVEPGIPHVIIRVDGANPAFSGHMRSGAPGIFAIDTITKDHIEKVSPVFTTSAPSALKGIRSWRTERKYSPDQARDDHGRWTDGGSDGTDSGAHAVGVSDDPNSQSLFTKTPGQQPGESDEAYNERIFREGMEKYPPADNLEAAAVDYRDELRLVQPKVEDFCTIEAPVWREREIGQAFANAKSDPNDPLVQRCYADLVKQTNDQWHLLTDPKEEGGLGIKVDFVSPDQIRAGYSTGLPDAEGLNPYPTAALQRDDIVQNGHLAIASIADYPSAYHPLLSNERGGEYDMFRAVHDAFGHAATGADFTRHGEFEAWIHHASMFTGDGRRAASTELTGENSYLVTTHEPATHKAAILPDELIALPFDPQGNLDVTYWRESLRALAGTKAAAILQGGNPSRLRGGEAEIFEKFGVVNSRNALFGAIARGLKIGKKVEVKSDARPSADDDNKYDITRVHHTSLGRTFHRNAKYSPDEPRDDHGRWTDDGGGGEVETSTSPAFSTDRPTFPGSVVAPIARLAEGKASFAVERGLPKPTLTREDFAKITADPERGTRIAHDYAAMPERSDDPATHAAYDSLAKEVDDQYAFLTKDMGVKVEFLDHDPYENVTELTADLRDNNHLGVLRTDETGPHPYLTNEQNDRFRAVHDAFGHAASGRGFDRNGEEAAWQSHREMFTDAAIPALTTETRGQNSAMVYGGTGTFVEQKLGLLPAIDWVKLMIVVGMQRKARKRPPQK